MSELVASRTNVRQAMKLALTHKCILLIPRKQSAMDGRALVCMQIVNVPIWFNINWKRGQVSKGMNMDCCMSDHSMVSMCIQWHRPQCCQGEPTWVGQKKSPPRFQGWPWVGDFIHVESKQKLDRWPRNEMSRFLWSPFERLMDKVLFLEKELKFGMLSSACDSCSWDLEEISLGENPLKQHLHFRCN